MSLAEVCGQVPSERQAGGSVGLGLLAVRPLLLYILLLCVESWAQEAASQGDRVFGIYWSF